MERDDNSTNVQIAEPEPESKPTPSDTTDDTTITWNGISDGDTVQGNLLVFIETTGFKDIKKVVFTIDNKRIQTERFVPYYLDGDNVPYDTTNLSNGEHTITVTVHEANGTTVTETITMNVANDTTSIPTPDTRETNDVRFDQSERVAVTDRVKVRETAGGTVFGTQESGAVGVVLDMNARQSGDYVYLPIDFNQGVDGWVAQDYLRRATTPVTPTPAPEANPTPEPTPEPDPTPTDTSIDTPRVDDTVSPTTPDTRVRTTANLNVRSQPNGRLIGQVSWGTAGTQSKDIDPRQVAGNTWVYVTFDSGLEGYVASEFIQTTTGTTVTNQPNPDIMAQIQLLLEMVQVLQARLNALMAR